MKHLLLISVGPVQDFIAQARRSRDLWFGSHLLSELSRAVARSVATSGELIFPALKAGDRELEACDRPVRPGPGGKPPEAVANKILAELNETTDPAGCARQARLAAINEWKAIAVRVRRERLGDVLAPRVDLVWQEQVDDILEFYATWVPLDQNYNAARRAAERALAGRKNLRDFRPWQQGRPGAPKSSLDGARVSILKQGAERQHSAFRRLRINPGEQLDAIGLIKRAGFDPEQFVPLANVAAGAWLAQAKEHCVEELSRVSAACGSRKIPKVRRELPVCEPLPFDASVLYRSRWAPLFKELEQAELDASVARAWGEKNVTPLFYTMRKKEQRPEPPPYVACLRADGDHMGRAIGKLRDAQANRQFSKQLAQFPKEARHIVEQEHCGSLIYAGGDDVLAFLPVATAPACAVDLTEAFKRVLAPAVDGVDTPTLSVGIAVGHMLEAMSTLLELARNAERAAKDPDRNALAIIVDKRSGGRRQLRLGWERNPLDRMRKDAALLANRLATGKLHELEALLNRFPDPQKHRIPADAAPALAAYATDILAHGPDEAVVKLDELGVNVVPEESYEAVRDSLLRAINRVLIVRSLREWGFA